MLENAVEVIDDAGMVAVHIDFRAARDVHGTEARVAGSDVTPEPLARGDLAPRQFRSGFRPWW